MRLIYTVCGINLYIGSVQRHDASRLYNDERPKTRFHLRQSLSKGENAFLAERFITCR
jgi:hypothetical protein